MIRPYEPSDSEQLWQCKRAFESAMGETGDEEKTDAYAAKLTDEYRDEWLDWVRRCVSEVSCLFVHDDGDRLGGYIFLLPERLAFIWDGAVINELYVRPELRGTGVADDLMDRAVEHAREQSLPLDRLLLDVDGDNERARSFYERYGFTRWGEMLAREI